MLSIDRTFVAIALIALLWGGGCTPESGTEADQIDAEQADVEEASEDLNDARELSAEEQEDLKEMRQELRDQVEIVEEAEDAVGDAQRQLQKEKGDLEAERTDPEPPALDSVESR
ncbi:MAG: hypothetical protein KDA52_00715 [Planctomycetaceae bacterium]|nr:hypothetical protein [Planctomycetaceae bacterium]